MSTILSNRVQKIKPSATLAVSDKAKQLKAQGVKSFLWALVNRTLIHRSIFKKPPPRQLALVRLVTPQSMEHRNSKKPSVRNLKEKTVSNYSDNEVMVSSGGKQVFYNLCQAILSKGDEVIIPAPYWVSYPDIAILADATPVFIETGLEQEFKITAEQLESSINANTKLFVLNSPSNPTGAVYTKSEIESLGAVLERHPQVNVISDDIYEHIRWEDDKFVNIAMACPKLKDRTIILNGVSKAYAMTGWRIGYAAGPEDIIKAMKKIQGQSTSNPSSISQAAALEAISGDQSFINMMVEAFERRHNFLVDSLNAIDGIECPQSRGAFYSFPRVQGLIDRLGLKDDVEFSTYCLDKISLALVPGSAFGAPGYVRLSFATSMDNLKLAIERLSNI